MIIPFPKFMAPVELFSRAPPPGLLEMVEKLMFLERFCTFIGRFLAGLLKFCEPLPWLIPRAEVVLIVEYFCSE